MKNRILFFLLIFLLLVSNDAFCQKLGILDFFKEIHLKIDTNEYVFPKDTVIIKKIPHLFFQYSKEDATVEVSLIPSNLSIIKYLKILPSGDYRIIDSMSNYIQNLYVYKIRFKEITSIEFLKLNFLIQTIDDTIPSIQQLHLFPFTKTVIEIKPLNDNLFIGEEKAFEIYTNNPSNIRYSNTWTMGNKIDYLITEKFGQLQLHLIPNEIGTVPLELTLKSYKPTIDKNGKISYDLPRIIYPFAVKKSRLSFLNIEPTDIIFNDESRLKGIEINIDNNRNLQLDKTYRIENQESPGGALFGELFTRSNLSNNKVLCWLRVYNYHRKSEGYLYIKDNDNPLFLTNFNISPKTSIHKISTLHIGEDWSENLNVNPGEIVEVKIEGVGLNKAKFDFDGINDLKEDSLIKNENIIIYKFKVPLTILKKEIEIYNHAQKTGYSLKIKEYERPAPFDYIYINYGDLSKKVSLINKPILYNKIIKDVNLNFNRDLIENYEKIYGKQHLRIDLRITNKKNELIEMRSIENIVVCPGKNSPRYEFYNGNCKTQDINLNDFISRKTYDLDEWSKIEIIIQHDKNKYGELAESKKIELYLQRKTTFDIEVSFPAGLLTAYKQDVTTTDKDGNEITKKEFTYGSLGGISMAMIAQISFYNPNRIAQYRPYKLGAGFLALNAFNLNAAEKDRDFGAVIIGSLYPAKRDRKLTFPLYFGGGYFLKAKTWFFLIGPGINVRF